MGDILVGTCSWTDPSLLRSGWYPATVQTAEARLRYYASRFRLVEVDSTYYALPSQQAVALWLARTPNDFVFNIKAFAPLTQHTLDPKVVPPELRAGLLQPPGGRQRLYHREVPPSLLRELWRRFHDGLLPMYRAGKLGAVLLQFPPWFHISRANRDYLAQARAWLPDYRLAVEFRHISWLQERNRQQTLDHLADLSITYVCVDEPQGFRSSVPPVAATTNPDLAMVRLHGRNRDTWEARDATPAERFNYRYSTAELNEWVPQVQHLADEAAQTHVLFNNCYADNGVRNAEELTALLGNRSYHPLAQSPLPGLTGTPNQV